MNKLQYAYENIYRNSFFFVVRNYHFETYPQKIKHIYSTYFIYTLYNKININSVVFLGQKIFVQQNSILRNKFTVEVLVLALDIQNPNKKLLFFS